MAASSIDYWGVNHKCNVMLMFSPLLLIHYCDLLNHPVAVSLLLL